MAVSQGSQLVFVPSPRRTLILIISVLLVLLTLLSLRQALDKLEGPVLLQPFEGTTFDQIEQCRNLLQANLQPTLRPPAALQIGSKNNDDGAIIQYEISKPVASAVPGIVNAAPIVTLIEPVSDKTITPQNDDDDDLPAVGVATPSETAHIAQVLDATPLVKPACNPFKEVGFVKANGYNNWMPTLSKCAPLPFSAMPLVLKHLRNKRIFFYGDSILRFAARDFCEQIGARWKWHNTPKDYYWVHTNQGLHTCTIKELNFTVVDVYTYGLKDWNMTEYPYLSQHVSIKNDTFINPTKWTFEHRLRSSHEMLTKEFGAADFIFMNSGLWDLPYLQKFMLEPERGIQQTVEPHPTFLSYYVNRMRQVVNLVRELQPKQTRKIFWVGLHDPEPLPRAPEYCMNGWGQELIDLVQVGCHAPERVRALRDTQEAVVADEREDGRDDISWLPYGRWVRHVEEDRRMRDDIHPSPYANQLLTMEILWEAREFDRVHGIVQSDEPLSLYANTDSKDEPQQQQQQGQQFPPILSPPPQLPQPPVVNVVPEIPPAEQLTPAFNDKTWSSGSISQDASRPAYNPAQQEPPADVKVPYEEVPVSLQVSQPVAVPVAEPPSAPILPPVPVPVPMPPQ